VFSLGFPDSAAHSHTGSKRGLPCKWRIRALDARIDARGNTAPAYTKQTQHKKNRMRATSTFRYKLHADFDSLLNPTFPNALGAWRSSFKVTSRKKLH
jgi:hypothetical protein